MVVTGAERRPSSDSATADSPHSLLFRIPNTVSCVAVNIFLQNMEKKKKKNIRGAWVRVAPANPMGLMEGEAQ